MKLSEANYDNSKTGCCAKFNPDLWNEKEMAWDHKPFVKDHVRSLFHIPINFGQVMKRDCDLIEKASAYPKEPLWLSDENSLWSSDLYIAVEKEVPAAENCEISGKFMTKVYEGPFKDVRKWIPDMNEYVKSKGKKVEKNYIFYTTCPKCAKQYGKNYVVIFAQVAN